MLALRAALGHAKVIDVNFIFEIYICICNANYWFMVALLT